MKSSELEKPVAETNVYTPRRVSPADEVPMQLADAQGAAGNQAVQRLVRSDNEETTTASIRNAAVSGIAGPNQPLPYLSNIQKAFGAEHDVSNVQAHVGGVASTANESMAAKAYTMGDHVAFHEQPNLHLAAHEATHVVQQRKGVALPGGVGQIGDQYERHANTVAEGVVAGQPVAGLLSQSPGIGIGGAMGGVGVQRQPAGGAPAPAAARTAQDVRNAHTTILGGEDVSAIGGELVTMTTNGNYQLVVEVIDEMYSWNRDDVAMVLLSRLATTRIIDISKNAAGNAMLRRLRGELSSGWTGEDEGNKVLLLGAVLNEPADRIIWNRRRIEARKATSPSDLESLAMLFEDDEIVDDGTVTGRLQSILSVTEHLVVPGLQTGIDFEDTGFRGDQNPGGAGFRDPHPSSRNQVGHFLTAVSMEFRPEVVSRQLPYFGSVRSMVGAPPAMSDADVALRLTIGHEKAPDPNGGLEVLMNVAFSGIVERLSSGPEGETDEQRDERVGQAMVRETQRQVNAIIAAFRRQFQATTDADVAAWNEALAGLGTAETLNTGALEGPTSPLNRIAIDPAGKGNSRQDLRLSLVGWRLSQMLRQGEFANRAAVARWIRINLGPAPAAAP
jgi:hypothetical protein